MNQSKCILKFFDESKVNPTELSLSFLKLSLLRFSKNSTPKTALYD